MFLKGHRIDEESTQVIRLIFKFEQPDIEAEARQRNCFDVYRSMLYWVMSVYGHTEDDIFWGTAEQERFLTRHTWTDERRAFAERYYRRVASAIAKWIDDCGLFVFGYLVRLFWLNVSELQITEGRKLEDEIWVASIFHLNVNVIRPINPPGQTLLPL